MEPVKWIDNENPYKNPVEYLKHIGSPEIQSLRCTICFDFALKPLRCIGPCRKIICGLCYTQWRSQKNECPSRCSNPFVVERIQDQKIQYICPFDKQCTKPIISTKQFEKHYRVCYFLGINDNRQIKYKQNSKCRKGHQLQSFCGTSKQKFQQAICVLCGLKKNSQLKCRKCDQTYCSECRKPNFSRSQCPEGHKLRQLQSCPQVFSYCNICSKTPIDGQKYYHDGVCLSDICIECYKQLPIKRQQTKYQINNPQKCDKDHALLISKQKKMIKCSSCEKQKLCVKQCFQCNQYYCLTCKVSLISGKSECSLSHKFIKQQNQQKCMKCYSTQKDKVLDKQCGILLCKQCFQYCNQVFQQNNKYLIQVLCLSGHNLKYFPNFQEFYAQCSLCNEPKILKVCCFYCCKGMLFCIQCKPPPVADRCFLKHSLNQAQMLSICQMCTQVKQGVKICRDCDYRICKQCIQLLQLQKIDEMQEEMNEIKYQS